MLEFVFFSIFWLLVVWLAGVLYLKYEVCEYPCNISCMVPYILDEIKWG